MTDRVTIGPEAPSDWDGIRAVHIAAFGGTAEADLVGALRAQGDLLLSLVARTDDLAGHIAFSPLAIPETPSVRACALAPLAVLPSHQGQGIGSALVEDGLQRLADEGMDLVLVLGDPEYYSGFGFSPEAAENLRTPYDGPHLQALALTERGAEARGPVAYARAFAELA